MRKGHDLISVIVPTYNRAEMLKDALQTLLDQRTNGKFSFEIIVVNNASTDRTAAVLEEVQKKHPLFLRYAYEENKGVADAMNRGIREARGEWLAFFDDDQLAEEDWLEQLYEAAIQTGASIVGGRVYLDLPPDELANIGNVCRRVLRENNFYDVVHKYEGKNLPGTGNVLVARKVFDSIGLFEVSGVLGTPDCDLFSRAGEAGFSMVFSPTAAIRHRISPARLTAAYFKWDTLMIGKLLAYLDYKHKGMTQMLFFLAARIGQALLVNLPLLLIALIRQNSKEILDRKCLLWQAVGYVRVGFFFISPGLFAQEEFFANLDFRKGREILGPLDQEQKNRT
jgi:glycosyltransferase involved in cell wall biosynthesis